MRITQSQDRMAEKGLHFKEASAVDATIYEY